MASNRCPNCDYDELEPEDRTCPACGYALARPQPLWIWVGLGALVLLIIIGLFWALPRR